MGQQRFTASGTFTASITGVAYKIMNPVLWEK